MDFSSEQLAELERAALRHPDAHVRSRAIAVRAVALGHTRVHLSDILPYTAFSIGQWCRDYHQRGLDAFRIAPGRGRPSHVDTKEVLLRLRRSPREFGIDRSRWTLAALGQACPSLGGMSERGILDVVHRLGFRFKRGQPWIHSPDPLYDEKKTPSKKRTNRPRKTNRS